MSLLSTLKCYCQLVAILYVFLSTLILFVSICWILASTSFYFLGSLFLLMLDMLVNPAFLTLSLAWVLAISLPMQKLVSFFNLIYGPKAVESQFRCDLCQEDRCEVIMPHCLHKFHEGCLPYDQKYVCL